MVLIRSLVGWLVGWLIDIGLAIDPTYEEAIEFQREFTLSRNRGTLNTSVCSNWRAYERQLFCCNRGTQVWCHSRKCYCCWNWWFFLVSKIDYKINNTNTTILININHLLCC
jgi:hypothetical protein